MDQHSHLLSLSAVDLENLYRQHKVAATVIHGELMRRQNDRIADAPGSLGDAVRDLHRTAESINASQSLKKKSRQQVERAVDILLCTEENDSLYRQFLDNVIRGSSPGIALLCVAGVSRRRILDLGTRKSELLEYVLGAQQSLKSAYLERLAKVYKLLPVPERR